MVAPGQWEMHINLGTSGAVGNHINVGTVL